MFSIVYKVPTVDQTGRVTEPKLRKNPSFSKCLDVDSEIINLEEISYMNQTLILTSDSFNSKFRQKRALHGNGLSNEMAYVDLKQAIYQ